VEDERMSYWLFTRQQSREFFAKYNKLLHDGHMKSIKCCTVLRMNDRLETQTDSLYTIERDRNEINILIILSFEEREDDKSHGGIE
jgi:hypothetical protein